MHWLEIISIFLYLFFLILHNSFLNYEENASSVPFNLEDDLFVFLYPHSNSIEIILLFIINEWLRAWFFLANNKILLR